MKTIFVVLALLIFPAVTQAQYFPHALGFEASMNGAGIVGFAHACNPGTFVNGTNCFQLPQGGKIQGYKFQTSLKVPGEQLWFLLVTPTRTWERGAAIASNHVVSKKDSATVITTEDPGNSYWTPVPAGWYVWVWGEGYGKNHPAGAESQTILWIVAPSVVVP